ncbi:MAG: hypothetical protein RBR23_01510 [Arcobacteraceae bacterium]|jgi:hypothetical protein|nr:hypothetical protein [Arcobacteraceae bacterium]
MENLSNYLHAIEEQLIPELKNELSKEDNALFKEWKKSIGTDNYWKWYISNIDEIKKYTKSTPAQRNKMKKWNSSELIKVQYKVASIHFLQKAITYIATYQTIMLLNHDSSYRGLAANAGEASFCIQNIKEKLYLL